MLQMVERAPGPSEAAILATKRADEAVMAAAVRWRLSIPEGRQLTRTEAELVRAVDRLCETVRD